jgi:hypothetical protein
MAWNGQARRHEWAGSRERINFWDAGRQVLQRHRASSMRSSPDKCLAQDAFLLLAFEIKSEDACNMGGKIRTREKSRAGSALPIDELGPHKCWSCVYRSEECSSAAAGYVDSARSRIVSTVCLFALRPACNLCQRPTLIPRGTPETNATNYPSLTIPLMLPADR